MGDGTGDPARRTVLFVCQHGAGKSRIAAAWFNSAAPTGLWATSAGVEPQASVSVHAPRLLAGTAAESLLDYELPRPLAAVADPAVVVAIDCRPGPGTLPGALMWELTNGKFGPPLSEELRRRSEGLARSLAAPATPGAPIAPPGQVTP